MAELVRYRVVRRAVLGSSHTYTGNCRHGLTAVDGTHYEMGKPHSLEIHEYGSDIFYLFYLDAGGEMLTDSLHSDLQGALEQAEFEFLIQPGEWEAVSEDREYWNEPSELAQTLVEALRAKYPPA